MTIYQYLLNVAAPGQVDLPPRLARVDCDNTLVEVTTAGFLNDSALYDSEGPVLESDFVLVNFDGGQGIFTPSVDSDGIVTLSEYLGSGTISGDLTLTDGNVILGTAANSLTFKTGPNGSIGTFTLTAGTQTIANTSIEATDVILPIVTTPGGTQGNLSYSLIAATSLTLTSDSNTDTSSGVWIRFRSA